MATPTVVKKIIRLKEENSGLFAWEIREQLQQQRICDPSSVPSISSINRILRNSGLWTDEMTTNQQNAQAAAAQAAASGAAHSSGAAGGVGSIAGTSHTATSTPYTTSAHLYHSNSTGNLPPTEQQIYSHTRSGHSQNPLTLANPYAYRDLANLPNTLTNAHALSQEHPIKPSPKHPMAATLTAASAATSTAQLTPQDLSYSAALQKHWFWNPSLLYYTQHVQQAATQFFPYASAASAGTSAHPSSNAAAAAAAYFPTSLHGGYTKSESSIDLTNPGTADALSDCDSGKSSPATINLTTSSTNSTTSSANASHRLTNPRKRNPYSIEELLKKPEKRLRLSASMSEQNLKISPKKLDDCNTSVCSSSSSSRSSHVSGIGDDSCDEDQKPTSLLAVATNAVASPSTTSTINEAQQDAEDNCETLEVVN